LRPRRTGERGANAFAHQGDIPMLDVIMLAMGLGFFVLSIGYAVACDRL
jgi:hypothetical protein